MVATPVARIAVPCFGAEGRDALPRVCAAAGRVPMPPLRCPMTFRAGASWMDVFCWMEGCVPRPSDRAAGRGEFSAGVCGRQTPGQGARCISDTASRTPPNRVILIT